MNIRPEWTGFIIAVLMLAAVDAGAETTPPSRFENWEEVVSQLYEKEDWAGLIGYTQQWTQAEKENAAAWQYLSFAYYKEGQYEHAVDAARVSLRYEPDNIDALALLCKTYSDSGRYEQSIEACRKALDLDAKSVEDIAWRELARSYIRTGQYDKANEVFNKELAARPDNEKVWKWLCIIQYRQREYKKTIQTCKEAARLDATDGDAWLFLSAAYTMDNDLDHAHEAFERFKAIEPDTIRAFEEGFRRGLEGVE